MYNLQNYQKMQFFQCITREMNKDVCFSCYTLALLQSSAKTVDLTYCALVKKMQTETLTDAEKSLQIELYKELKYLEKKAYFADYNLVIYLIVDGKTYKVGTYKPVKTYL